MQLTSDQPGGHDLLVADAPCKIFAKKQFEAHLTS